MDWKHRLGKKPERRVRGLRIVRLLLSDQEFKVWEIQVELRDQLNQAEAYIAQLKRFSLNTARSTYSQIAWGNRFGAPTAKEKQSQLDAIDAQLLEFKVTPEELADIQRPFVKMVRLDFFFLFQGVLAQYATIKNSKLVEQAHAAAGQPGSLNQTLKHGELITAWNARTANKNWNELLERETLEDVLNDFIPKAGERLDEKELAIFQKFKGEIVRLNADCEKKGGYTPDAVKYYDRYSGDHNIDRATQLWNEVLQ